MQEDELQFYQHESYSIERLGTMSPRGLNRRKEVPPPIPFTLTYCNQTLKIKKIIKILLLKYYRKNLSKKSGTISISNQKEQSLKDLLVHTDLHQ